jgi:hypothetical protein
MKNNIIFILLLLVVIGCAAAKPAVWMEKGVSLSGYKVFEVMPVSNETGKTFEFDVANELTQHIKSKLKDKGYIISEEKKAVEGVLIIKSSLIVYEPGSAFKRWILTGLGKTQCTLKTSLVDKKTGKVLGEMLAAEEVSSGGLYSIEADKWILNVVAKSISDEIDRKVKGE